MNLRNSPKRPFTLIMADDDEDDRLLAQDAMEEAGGDYLCHTVNNGQELLDYLRCEGKFSHNDSCESPSVILLDLNMPIMDGRETLKQLKADPFLSHIPVVILSTSSADEDINVGYGLGASSYMVKPHDFGSLVQMMKCFNVYWFDSVSLPNVSASEAPAE